MGEWERRWRGPPRDPDEELPMATVRFLDSLRVMVADTHQAARATSWRSGPATLRKTMTATTGRGRCSPPKTSATTCARRSGGRRRI